MNHKLNSLLSTITAVRRETMMIPWLYPMDRSDCVMKKELNHWDLARITNESIFLQIELPNNFLANDLSQPFDRCISTFLQLLTPMCVMGAGVRVFLDTNRLITTRLFAVFARRRVELGRRGRR